MTTNKPEVFEVYRTRQGTLENVVLLTDYEALQAECDALRAKTRLSLGVGDGAGNLFVHGDYDSIKRVQALIFENEKLRKDAERYRYIKKGNQWIVAATQTGFHVDGEELDDFIDSEMEQQK